MTTITAKKSAKKFYIGERGNPQFAKPYFKAYGQLSKTEARRKEDCIYGSMTLTAFDTEENYKDFLKKIESEGFRIV